MVKINKNSVVGILALFIFVIFGVIGVQGGVFKYVLFGFLHLILAAATFVLLTFAVEGQDKNKKGVRFFWSDLAPFAIVLLIARLVAGWDFYIVFYFLGMLYLVLNESFYRLNVMRLSFSDADFYKPIAVGLGSAVLYTMISLVGGAPV